MLLCTVSVPCAGQFGDDITDRIDHIGVVAQSADHGVVAGAAAEDVVAAIAGQHVVQRVAGGIDRGDSGQRQVLDIGAKDVS